VKVAAALPEARPGHWRRRSLIVFAYCAWAVTLFGLAPRAWAYRPFDGTDAAVAETGEMEIEFGPAGYLRTGSQSWMVAPAAIANLGVASGWELVLEGKQLWRLGSATPAPADSSRLVLTDNAFSLKHVLVDGILQGRPRPGLACEVSALLPALHEEGGFGAAAVVILSSSLGPVVTHLNLQAIFSRTHEPGGFLGLIVEGPQRWPVRPVLELAGERERGGTGTLSALAGFIWTVSPSLAIDGAIRAGWQDEPLEEHVNLLELRLGLTWSFPVFRRNGGCRHAES
jgi:hypothetical protein